MASIHNLPAEIICEIFDKDPKAGLQLANTNKWMSEVLKDKIKKHRQLIRECNAAAICYTKCFDKNIKREYMEVGLNISGYADYESYFHCVNCFYSFRGNSFLLKEYDKNRKTGVKLCTNCDYELYHQDEKLDDYIDDDFDDDEDEDGFLALSIFKNINI